MNASFSAASPYALYPHQLTGVEFLKTKGRAILCDDIGLQQCAQGTHVGTGGRWELISSGDVAVRFLLPACGPSLPIHRATRCT
jgi:hypothetical protein